MFVRLAFSFTLKELAGGMPALSTEFRHTWCIPMDTYCIPVDCNVTQLRTRITRGVSQVSMSSVPLTGSVGLDFCDTLFLLGLIVKQGVRLLKETNT